MITIKDLSFSYGKKKVLDHLNINVQEGELIAIMGPSGCGKSTLLNLIAGTRKPDSGSIELHATKIAYVFQEPRLFPWLTVEENLRAVNDREELTEKEIAQVLKDVDLEDAAKQYPAALSGGMKSRASLARALLYGGDLFLLDEPFSALDEELRRDLSIKLRALLKEKGATAIMVTHQSEDARLFADRVITL